MPHIAILGAGPSGCAAAITLARAGRTVTLFQRPAAGVQTGECLPPHAKPLLRELGVWEAFCGGGHLPCYGNASAWGGAELATTDFIRHPYGHGWHLDRTAFDRMLLDAALGAGAELRDAEPEARIEVAAPGWKLGAVRADWVVDCTGRQAWFARRLGVRRLTLDTLVSHVAVFAAGPDDCERVTLIEATREGWWYTAGIPGGRRVAAYHADSGSQTSRMAHADDGFRALMAETSFVQGRMAVGAPLAGPSLRPANTSRLERFTGERWLAAGDAAAAYDPLSSHGILAAIDFGTRAARAIVENSPGEYEKLVERQFAEYLRQRAGYYGMESRWGHFAFWKSRTGGSQEVASS